MSEQVPLEAMQEARAHAKRDLIAQAWMISRDAEESAERIRGYIKQAKDGDLEEWAMVQEIQAEVHRLAGESPLVQLLARLQIFQLADMEYHRAVNAVARDFDLS